MEPYQPISRDVFEVLEEKYLLKEAFNLTFLQDYIKRTIIDAIIMDLYTEDGAEYMILEGGVRLRLDQVLAINGKPVQYWV
jgi:hypothetical protein